MIRSLVLLLALAASLGSVSAAHAQLPATAPAAQPTSAAPAPDQAQAKELIQTLNDPDKRAKLIQQLQLLTQQQQAAQKPPEPEPFGTRLLKYLLGKADEARDEAGALADAFAGLPAAAQWGERQWTDPSKRERWVELFEALAVVVAAGAAVFALARWAVRTPIHAIQKRKPATILGRFFLSLLRLAIDLLPIAAVEIVCYALMSASSKPLRVNLAILTIVNASLLVLSVKAAARFFLAPACRNLRLLPMSDRPALFLYRWIFRLAVIASFGWFGVSALHLLGLPKVAAAAALKVDGLVILGILITLIVRKRRGVAKWIRGADPKTPAAMTVVMSMRRSLAGVWHVLAVAYLVATFGVWIFDIESGFEFALRGTVYSLTALGGARLVIAAAEWLIERAVAFSHADGSFPRVRRRVDVYLPVARSSLSVVVWLVAALVVIEVWGLGVFDWFDTPAGEAVLGRTASIAFVVLGALVAWEIVSAVIEVYLVGAIRNGTPIERSQRVRTLLPLLRNAFMVFLVVVVMLTVLSELGINIAPLLAGAGVVGVAIGFGAQTLVKDIITGMFILFENTIAVGDVVDVGGGHTGLVEHFSLRTLKVRDGTGGLHTVPFSAVATVNNMSKDFSNYVFNIKVDYGQDTDRIVKILADLGKEMQDDADYGGKILAPLDIFGVDSFGTESLVIQASFKTKPLQQWGVGREFNRRLKKKFDELGIQQRIPERFVMMPTGVTTQTTDVEAEPKVGKKS